MSYVNNCIQVTLSLDTLLKATRPSALATIGFHLYKVNKFIKALIGKIMVLESFLVYVIIFIKSHDK